MGINIETGSAFESDLTQMVFVTNATMDSTCTYVGHEEMVVLELFLLQNLEKKRKL